MSAPANAFEAPLLYSRDNIVIRHDTGPAALPWQQKASSDAGGIAFDVEVRDAMTIYRQQGWYNLSSLSEKNGVLMAFAESQIWPVTHLEQYAPLDILMVDIHGKIMQIIPNIVLANLDQDIVSEMPVLAFLFLKGGTCEKLSIHPGDVVDYKLFKKPPAVLSTPSPPSSPAAPSSAATPR